MDMAIQQYVTKEKMLKDMQGPEAAPTVQALNTAGITMVPVLPGRIVHSNDVKPEEMHQAILLEPRFQGISPEHAAAMAEWSLTWISTKSMTVAPPNTTQQQQQLPAQASPSAGAEEDPLTDLEMSEDEAEAEKASSKEGDVARTTKKVQQSEKQRKVAARKAMPIQK